MLFWNLCTSQSMRSPSSTHTPNWNAVCVCWRGCVCACRLACVSPYVSMYMLVCVICGSGAHLYVYECQKKLQKIHMCLINARDNTPKGWKKQTAIKKQVTIQLQCDSWMVPYLKWTTEAIHGTRRHLVTFTVWWFTLNACLKFVPWKSGFHCS